MSKAKSKGGSGVRDAGLAYIALFGKFTWYLLHDSLKLGVYVLAHEYLSHNSILNVSAAKGACPL